MSQALPVHATPIAHAHIPSWGDVRVPVLAIGGATWTVLGPHGVRSVRASEINHDHVTVTRCELVARNGSKVRWTAAVPESATGPEWRRKRLRQIRWCVGNGFRVCAGGGEG